MRQEAEAAMQKAAEQQRAAELERQQLADMQRETKALQAKFEETVAALKESVVEQLSDTVAARGGGGDQAAPRSAAPPTAAGSSASQPALTAAVHPCAVGTGGAHHNTWCHCYTQHRRPVESFDPPPFDGKCTPGNEAKLAAAAETFIACLRRAAGPDRQAHPAAILQARNRLSKTPGTIADKWNKRDSAKHSDAAQDTLEGFCQRFLERFGGKPPSEEDARKAMESKRQGASESVLDHITEFTDLRDKGGQRLPIGKCAVWLVAGLRDTPTREKLLYILRDDMVNGDPSSLDASKYPDWDAVMKKVAEADDSKRWVIDHSRFDKTPGTKTVAAVGQVADEDEPERDGRDSGGASQQPQTPAGAVAAVTPGSPPTQGDAVATKLAQRLDELAKIVDDMRRKCDYCGKRGHIATACRTRLGQQQQTQQQQQQTQQQHQPPQPQQPQQQQQQRK
jgi:hypothetical protein